MGVINQLITIRIVKSWVCEMMMFIFWMRNPLLEVIHTEFLDQQFKFGGVSSTMFEYWWLYIIHHNTGCICFSRGIWWLTDIRNPILYSGFFVHYYVINALDTPVWWYGSFFGNRPWSPICNRHMTCKWIE